MRREKGFITGGLLKKSDKGCREEGIVSKEPVKRQQPLPSWGKNHLKAERTFGLICKPRLMTGVSIVARLATWDGAPIPILGQISANQ